MIEKLLDSCCFVAPKNVNYFLMQIANNNVQNTM